LYEVTARRWCPLLHPEIPLSLEPVNNEPLFKGIGSFTGCNKRLTLPEKLSICQVTNVPTGVAILPKIGLFHQKPNLGDNGFDITTFPGCRTVIGGRCNSRPKLPAFLSFGTTPAW
jgi:hypothetical protein